MNIELDNPNYIEKYYNREIALLEAEIDYLKSKIKYFQYLDENFSVNFCLESFIKTSQKRIDFILTELEEIKKYKN